MAVHWTPLGSLKNFDSWREGGTVGGRDLSTRLLLLSRRKHFTPKSFLRDWLTSFFLLGPPKMGGWDELDCEM